MRLVVILSFFVSVAMADKPQTEYFDAEIRYLFVPVGFDSNDPDVLVVIDGVMPDTCYRLDQPDVERVDSKTFSIRANMHKVAGNCLPFAVPFTQEVKLGQLKAGSDYVAVARAGSPKELFVVEEAKPETGIDDYNYATVDAVEVTQKDNAQVAVLKGPRINTCLEFDEIRASTVNGKSIEIRPLIKKTATGPNGAACKNVDERFSVEKVLPPMSLGRHLVHVRSSGGQAVNRVYTNLVPPKP
ncbi:MAG: hypothetical protein HYR96_00590 [Deltaproteobacteria bacterium]|nr:hypothetical protein [Deltaproteobacteria bacterium]MBI3294006.1 hypothetical protein [Deltaproteobacteria bacterium]